MKSSRHGRAHQKKPRPARLLLTVMALVAMALPLAFAVPLTSGAGAAAAAAVATESSTVEPGIVEVAAGGWHTCALRMDGQVQCWGRGDQGRLGYGNTVTIGDDEHPSAAGTVDLGQGRSAVQLAVGASHTCALLDDRTVRCWGVGALGQLGYGNTENVGDDETPADAGPVDVAPPGRTIEAITAGGDHTCARLDNGSVVCWGFGEFGRLGYGNTENIGDDETPASAGPVNIGGAATSVAAGGLHTCALIQGTLPLVRCWGVGHTGALGSGNRANIGDNETPASRPGVLDVGFLGTPVTSISAGVAHTCAIVFRQRQGNLAKCWGTNEEGRLGYGNTETIGDDEAGGSAGAVPLASPPRSLSLGLLHTCALLEDGGVRCWGSAGLGQLGDGSTDIGDDETALEATRIDLGPGGAAKMVSAGWLHTCAVLGDATVRCWGSGSDGRLGYASTDNIGDDETPRDAGPIQFVEPPVDDIAPDTQITTEPNYGTSSLWMSRRGSLSFASSEAGSTFECKINSGSFQPCTSPRMLWLGPGSHVFAVRARDAAGNVDPSPAVRQIRVFAF